MGGFFSSPAALPEDKHIVIIGAGYGGISLANQLMKHPGANFTIINPRDSFHHNVGGLRAVVQPGNITLSDLHLLFSYISDSRLNCNALDYI